VAAKARRLEPHPKKLREGGFKLLKSLARELCGRGVAGLSYRRERTGLLLFPRSLFGADGGGRTRTASRPRDFKSLASTGFATSAQTARFFHIFWRK
jgi:hypothetical protein